MTTTDVTRAEICIAACAEIWRANGEVMASPFGTIPALAARLAKATFSPDLVLTDGEAALIVGAPPLATRSGDLVREAQVPYKAIFSIVWSGRRHIMMMASQIDRYGNQNLSAIGNHDHPNVQLVGVRGAPGNSVNHKTSYWVPNHSPKTFVEQVDAVCGIGYDRAAAAGRGATRFHELPRVVSNLGVFDFSGPDHSMVLVSVHPGVGVDEVLAATGFALAINGDVPTTPGPTAADLELIRTVLDPRSARDSEVKA